MVKARGWGPRERRFESCLPDEGSRKVGLEAAIL